MTVSWLKLEIHKIRSNSFSHSILIPNVEGGQRFLREQQRMNDVSILTSRQDSSSRGQSSGGKKRHGWAKRSPATEKNMTRNKWRCVSRRERKKRQWKNAINSDERSTSQALFDSWLRARNFLHPSSRYFYTTLGRNFRTGKEKQLAAAAFLRKYVRRTILRTALGLGNYGTLETSRGYKKKDCARPKWLQGHYMSQQCKAPSARRLSILSTVRERV